MRGSARIRSAATLLWRSAAAPSTCRSLRAVPPAQPLSSYSWAPQCAIGAAERDEIERAARQTLRVLEKEPDIFSQAAVEDPVEADVLAAVQAEAASALAAELRSVAAPAEAGGRFYPVGDLQLRIRNTFSVLEHGLIERGLEARLLVLAALCGEHLLLLGPPGTAKSALSRQLSKALDAPYFERQLTRFSVPEELFGPLCERDHPTPPLRARPPLNAHSDLGASAWLPFCSTTLPCTQRAAVRHVMYVRNLGEPSTQHSPNCKRIDIFAKPKVTSRKPALLSLTRFSRRTLRF